MKKRLPALIVAFLAVGFLAVAQSPRPPEASAQDFATLVGKWYCSGDINKVCYVASAGEAYFAINEGSVAFALGPAQGNRVVFKGAGGSFPVTVLPQHLLGYNWWWSRTPDNSGGVLLD